ncbi:hypothetical protein [Marinimicrobium sp. ABcell2]|uniref:hypothetical protein n=1 Tax=Marinimicrobium sp. ABcell2 TaxID=3069751 RepID=UPI0027B7F2E0|nr:hypothetical protein [Marinimicrobium sp. ABcell2]MDQ2077824.1 hypothetical protein [Marinimicrobium sp. ABcell2]
MSSQALTQSGCFAMAGTYYEQVYCELQARGDSHGLPPMYEFRRNDTTTQALLLRRPAQRAGIDVPMPGARERHPSQPRREANIPEPAEPQPSHDSTKTASSTHSLAGCHMDGTRIDCDGRQYQLLGNQNNNQLEPGALEPDNALNLPVFQGNLNDKAAVNAYLHRAYQRYVEQMIAIGLGGVTMTYGRFAFLFEDVQEKGLDFGDRFETMYGFLKQDKRRSAVSEQLNPDPQLRIEHCDRLSDQLLVCSRGGRNRVFRAR